MGKRSTARKLAMQLIFLIENIGDHLSEEKINYFLKNEKASQEAKNYAEKLIFGIKPYLKEIDQLISKYSENWSLERMSKTDLAILRLAFYELAFLKETPPQVVIDEAVELAKKFSTEDSSAFVNGVLDAYLKSEKN